MKYEYSRVRNISINDRNDLEEVILIPYLHKPGFFIFPDDHRIAVSKSGDILNIKTGRILLGNLAGNKSIYIHLSNKDGKHSVYLKHRIIAKTFIGRPSRHLNKDYNDLVVNHINGDRSNNDITNLEWVTGKENAKHAHATGLCKKDQAVVAMNVFSKEELYFISTKECADAFKIHRATFHKHLKSRNKGKYHKNGFIFKYADDADFLLLPISKLVEIGQGKVYYRDVVIKELKTNKITIVSSIKEASKYINIPHVTLWRNLVKRGMYSINEVEITFL